VLQVMAKIEAARVAEQAKKDAALAQAAAAAAAALAKKSAVVTAPASALSERKLDGLAVVTDKTHTLVNSNMGVQLKLNALVSRRLADLTRDPADITAAELAERLYHEHQGKQAVVDSGSKTP
jgi:hypothetical protein